MTTDDRAEPHSDLAIPPGETLADEIASRATSQTELAARLGRPVQVVDQIIRGNKAITDVTALGLQKALGIPGGVLRQPGAGIPHDAGQAPRTETPPVRGVLA